MPEAIKSLGDHAELVGEHAELVGDHAELVGEHAELVGEHAELVGGPPRPPEVRRRERRASGEGAFAALRRSAAGEGEDGGDGEDGPGYTPSLCSEERHEERGVEGGLSEEEAAGAPSEDGAAGAARLGDSVRAGTSACPREANTHGGAAELSLGPRPWQVSGGDLDIGAHTALLPLLRVLEQRCGKQSSKQVSK